MLTISEFGRRTGLSHKALRLYDVSGLLPPAQVDPANGYRFYDEEQLERARRISVLRQLDMPLTKIAEVLAGSDEEALIRLDRWWAAEEATTASRRSTLQYLRDRLSRTGTPGLSPRPVLIRDVPATKIATIRADTDQQSLIGVIVSSTYEISAYLRAAGATLTGESWVIYHGAVTPEAEATVEVCMPFDGLVDPSGPITIRVEPAHREAYCTITMDECVFPRIMLAYDLVIDWVRAAGLPEAGPPREVYLPDCQSIPRDQPAVDIALPIVERNA
ncbi:MerR family transcriptional regulator [Kribbella kalugense]|uniref:DNA-binding transcriptional MerR regulator n=1 Tax=Kribbella kalugense TaxID=2512221 RepID=A0A4R7ZBN9_9ACTN|nr:MerR family transcriptional regulator [Kribbella kalugense]TDW14236.1 DNA-binding transcriptional MerR regulator [Kribbella kalugense]